jgi:hypothetical protein
MQRYEVFARHGCRVCGNTAAYPLRNVAGQGHGRRWQCGICHAVITDVVVRTAEQSAAARGRSAGAVGRQALRRGLLSR